MIKGVQQSVRATQIHKQTNTQTNKHTHPDKGIQFGKSRTWVIARLLPDLYKWRAVRLVGHNESSAPLSLSLSLSLSISISIYILIYLCMHTICVWYKCTAHRDTRVLHSGKFFSEDTRPRADDCCCMDTVALQSFLYTKKGLVFSFSEVMFHTSSTKAQ